MRVGVAAVLVLLTVSACGGSEAGPRVLPSVTVSPSASASASALPTGINAPTPAGAEAFVRAFYAELNRAFTERDPARLSTLSDPACGSCENFIRSVTRLRDRGERVDRFAIALDFVIPGPLTGNSVRVDAVWSAPPVTRFAADGSVISREPGLRGVEEELTLTRADGAWKVTRFVRTKVRG